jgi:hypothetical protein
VMYSSKVYRKFQGENAPIATIFACIRSAVGKIESLTRQ